MCTIPATATLDLSGRCPEAAPGPARLVFQSPQRPLLVFSFGHHSAPSWSFHSVTTAPLAGIFIRSPQRPLLVLSSGHHSALSGLFVWSPQRPLLVFSFNQCSAPFWSFHSVTTAPPSWSFHLVTTAPSPVCSKLTFHILRKELPTCILNFSHCTEGMRTGVQCHPHSLLTP